MRHSWIRLTAALMVFAALSGPAFAYTIYLKDGAKVIAKERYTIEGDRALIVLVNGTVTFIDADEIDVSRTENANRNNLGDALVLEGSTITEISEGSLGTAPESLRDLIERGEVQITQRAQVRRDDTKASGGGIEYTPAGNIDLRSLGRDPYGDLVAAEELLTLLRERDLENAAVWRGTEAGRPLVEVEASSEAAVFRAMTSAAEAFLAFSSLREDVTSMEVLIGTSARQRAGQFVFDTESATLLTDGSMSPAEFFVRHVQF